MPGYAEVARVDFGVAGDAVNQRCSTVNVTSFELYNGATAVSGGVYDARMGTTDHTYTCLTCGLQKKQCPGHPGSLQLRVPVQSPLMVAETRRWLRVVCLACGTPIIDPIKYVTVPKAHRLAEAASAQTEGRHCPKCRQTHPKIVKDLYDNFTFLAEHTNPGGAITTQKLYPHIIRAALERITDAAVIAFGRTLDVHPSKFILNTIQIPPITIRPGVKIGVGPGAQSYHDLNNMLQYIVKRNQYLPEHLPSGPINPDTDRLIQNLGHLYYDTILGSTGISATQGNNGKRGILAGSRAPPSILRRHPRKDGRFRKHLLGKRVWWMSRSTISGNSDLRIDEIGYPVAFARILQVEETVQEYNRDWLMTFFLNGRRRYPGSSRVFKRATGSYHEVEGLRRDFRLEIGDILFRDVITGDVGYFNRQPSLERSSIGVHRIVVLENPLIMTFQMNVDACAWYNADFDGDQMNFSVPRGVMSRAEAELVSSVVNHFISTKNSGPVNGQVQDSNVGSFALTRSDVIMDKYHAMALFQSAQVEPPNFGSGNIQTRYTGREIVSILFERTPVNYNRSPSWFSDVYVPYINYDTTETQTIMRHGVLKRGVLDKRSVGAGATGGIFHLISRSYGPKAALDAIFALQQLAINYVGNWGFTVSTNDMLLTHSAQAMVHDIIDELIRESKEITDRLLRGEIVPPIGLTTHQFYEQQQINALKIPDRILCPILASIDPDTNGLFQMIATKSKGSNPNMIHITSIVGQIEINNHRIGTQFAFSRTLPYYPRFAVTPEAFGFITNSYITGLTAPQFIFAMMNGRFDLINKALSTASTGYANRKAIFALQSCITDTLRHVTIDTKMVQLIYGEDGLDARQVENVIFRTATMDDEKLKKSFYFDLTARQLPTEKQEIFDKELKQLYFDRDNYRKIYLNLEDINFNHPFSDMRQMPVNVASIVEDLILRLEVRRETEDIPIPSLDEIISMYHAVDRFCNELPYVLINEIQRFRKTTIPSHLKAAVLLMQMLVRIELASVNLAQITPELLTAALDSIRLRYSQSLVEFGEAVGVLAAQAVSEPLTQYMLDSHHRSVSGGTNKSGIVRPQEIFGAKEVEAEQSPEMLLRIADRSLEADRAYVQDVANNIELMTLGRFLRLWDLLYEPFGETLYPLYINDDKWIDEFQRNHPTLQQPSDLTRWCIRLELNKTTMILKSMNLETIVGQLRVKYQHIYIVHTPENVDQIIIRIYMRSGVFRRSGTSRNTIDEEKIAIVLTEKLLTTPIRGILGINSARVVKIIRHKIDNNGGLSREQDLFAIRTVGTNIAGVLSNQEIDPLTIVSSSLGDTYKIFGIEAARQKIISEIRSVMGDSSPNIRHLMIYADLMTRGNRITSLEKGGLNLREHNNVLLRMAMSAPIQVLTDATLESAKSPVYGIAAPLTLGSIPRLGTLYSDIVMDEDFISKNTVSVDAVLDML
jgi:DNA-directed RNA polymerase beta' subunit